MWLFGKNSRRDAHQGLMVLAREVLGRFPLLSRDGEGIARFDVRSVPLEFRQQAQETLASLLVHTELPERAPKEVGTLRSLREAEMHLNVMKMHMSGIYPPALRSRSRALAYADIFMRLGELLDYIERTFSAGYPSRGDAFIRYALCRNEGLIAASREALSWFPNEEVVKNARRELGNTGYACHLLPRAAASAMVDKVKAIKKRHSGLKRYFGRKSRLLNSER